MAQPIISSFRRYEVKYFLTEQQRSALLPELEQQSGFSAWVGVCRGWDEQAEA